MRIGEMVADMMQIDSLMAECGQGKVRPKVWYYQYLIGSEFDKNLAVMKAQGGSAEVLMELYDAVVKEG